MTRSVQCSSAELCPESLCEERRAVGMGAVSPSRLISGIYPDARVIIYDPSSSLLRLFPDAIVLTPVGHEREGLA